MLKQVGALCGCWGLDEVLAFLRSSPWPAGWPVERTPLAAVSLAWAGNTADRQRAGVGTAALLSHPQSRGLLDGHRSRRSRC